MAEKRPICLYGGELQELASADTLPASSPSTISLESGLASAPSLNFIDDPDTGLSLNSGIVFSYGGQQRMSLGISGLSMSTGDQILADKGSLSSPGYCFGGMLTTGFSADTLVGGTVRLGISGTEYVKFKPFATTFNGDLFLEDSTPEIRFKETDVTTDNKLWSFFASGEVFRLRVINDAVSIATDVITIQRTGTTVDSITLNSDVPITGVLQASAGTNVAPSISFTGDTNTGFHHPVGDQIRLTLGGNDKIIFAATYTAIYNTVWGVDGSITAPTYAFNTDTNTGIYKAAADELGITAGGVQRARFTAVGVVVTGQVSISSATPTADDHAARRDYVDTQVNTKQAILAGVNAIELSSSLSGDRNSYIDFHASDSVDYSSRVLRGPGANGDCYFDNRGTGNIVIRPAVGGTPQLFIFNDTGELTLPVEPTGAGHATRKDYVDQVAASRNVIINGNFDVWQRGTSFTSVATLAYSADRFQYSKSGAMVHNISRSTAVPPTATSGLKSNYSLLLDVAVADTSLAASDECAITYKVEGYDYAQLAGSDATLSFWVRAAKTGVHCIGFRNSIADRSYVREYTVAAADTWEKHTVTVPLTQTAGTWNYTNGIGLHIDFVLAAGTNKQTTKDAWQTGNYYATSSQVNECDNVANNFRIAQVQFEAGDTATPLEYRSIAEERARCKRYYEKQVSAGGLYYRFGAGMCTGTTAAAVVIKWEVEKRDTPTITISAAGDFAVWSGTAVPACTSVPFVQINTLGAGANPVVASGLTAGYGAILRAENDANAWIAAASEL